MKSAFESYTPRPRPLRYDALAEQTGCQTIPGEQVGLFEPLSQFCIAEVIPDPERRAAYAFGPATLGDPPVHDTLWALWAASSGLRFGKTAYVEPPADNLGEISFLFPTGTYEQAALAFDADGSMIAATEAGGTVRVRWVQPDATSAEVSFAAINPVLWSTAVLRASDDGDQDVFLLYQKPAKERTIYARRFSDLFTEEILIIDALPVGLKRLYAAEPQGRHLLLRATDLTDRAITINSDDYPLEADDAGELGVSFTDGDSFQVTQEIEPNPERSALTLEFVSGISFQATVKPSALSDKPTSLGVAFTSGASA